MFIIITVFGAFMQALETKEIIKKRELPSIGLAIAARLDVIAYKYKEIGKELLQDNFLRNWIINGEKNKDALFQFMDTVKEKHNFIAASMVSERTETYYDTKRRVFKLSPLNVSRDSWYYLLRKSETKTNIDSWYNKKSNRLELYVNIPIYSKQGEFLGITGASFKGERFDKIVKAIDEYRDISFYIVRRDGKIVYATDEGLHKKPYLLINEIWNADILDTLRRQRLEHTGTIFDIKEKNNSILWGRYLESWDTMLLVEKKPKAIIASMKHTTLHSFLINGVFAVILCLLMFSAIRFMKKKMQMSFLSMKSANKRYKAVLYYQNFLFKCLETHSNTFESKLDVKEFSKKRNALDLWSGNSINTEENKRQEADIPLSKFMEKIVLNHSYPGALKDINLHFHIEKSDIFVSSTTYTLLRFMFDDIFDKLISLTPPGNDLLLSAAHNLEMFQIEIVVPISRDYLHGEFIAAAKALLKDLHSTIAINEPVASKSVIVIALSTKVL